MPKLPEAASDLEDSDMRFGGKEAAGAMSPSGFLTAGEVIFAEAAPLGSSKVTKGSLSRLAPSSQPPVLRGFQVLLLFAELISSLCLGKSLDFRNRSERRRREGFRWGAGISRVGAVVMISGAARDVSNWVATQIERERASYVWAWEAAPRLAVSPLAIAESPMHCETLARRSGDV